MELTDAELMECSQEDADLYWNLVSDLPKRIGNRGNYLDQHGVEIPYGSGPHIMRHLRDAIDIVKPENVLEIGLNMGWGSVMMLTISDVNVFSIDISDREETMEAGEILKRKFPNRFDYLICDSEEVYKHLLDKKFQMAFVDGGHDEKSVTADIGLCVELQIPYILFDDIYPRFGEVQKSIDAYGKLSLVKDMNNLRLYKNG